MPIKSENSEKIKAKKKLGKLIASCRRNTMSQRKLAAAVGLSPSNMKYIEDGVNAPSPEIYSKLIETLRPTPIQQEKMDQAYMIIRHAPPPDVSECIINDPRLLKLIRSMNTTPLTELQIRAFESLLDSFASTTTKGENNNG